ncbi:MAG: hypothetical protein L0Y72_27845 [Gemmataceae bacterium]|nr:hypothetical protein [Gemmataceae bacterium]MCI0742860.1 hypothetical protein [Gemmataceae bacterium]
MTQHAEKFPFHPTHIYRPYAHVRSAANGVFLPVVVILGAFTVGLVAWGAYQSWPSAVTLPEKYLRVGLSSPKFSAMPVGESGESAAPEELPPPKSEHTTEPPLAVPPMQVPAPPPIDLPAPVELPMALPKAAASKVESPPPAVETPLPPLPDVELPKLPAVELPKLPVVELPKLPAVELPKLPESVPIPLPPLPEEPKGEVVPVKAQTPPVIETSNPFVFREELFGETPMLRNWKTLAFSSLLSAAMFVPEPTVASAQDTKEILERIDKLDKSIQKSFENVKTDIDEVKKKLADVNKEVGALQGDTLSHQLQLGNANTKIEKIEAGLKSLRAEIDNLKKTGVAQGGDNKYLDDIRTTLNAIEQAILKLQPSTSRVALSPPSAAGRVMLVNMYPEELLFVINQKPYRVAPNASHQIEGVPAGLVRYEVLSGTWGPRANSSTNLASNETFTLTAR